MRLLATIVFTTCLYACPASSQVKMSAFVRSLYRESFAQSRSMAGSTGDTRQLCAFVQTDEQQARRVLNETGCRLLSQQGDIAIAMIPVSRLSELAARTEVKRIEASRSARLTMDTTRLVINALPVYEGQSLPQTYTGQGVVMGVMDIGFDLTHPTFLNDDRSGYRITRFWDQVSQDTIGSTLPVGRDFEFRDGQLTVQHSTDGITETHGTHTAGIAAGSGFDSAYRGMAPGAELCLVSNAVNNDTIYIDEADYYKYTSATDALGFQYIFDYADSVGRPCVISFSEGYHPYYDDVDLLFETYVDRMLGEGHILVTSSGNESLKQTYIYKPAYESAVGAYTNTYEDSFTFFMRSNQGNPRFSLLFGSRKNHQPVDSVSYAYSELPHCDFPSLDSARVIIDSLLVDTIPYAVTTIKYPSAYNPYDTICCVTLQADRALTLAHEIALVISGEGAEAEVFSVSGMRNYRQWTSAEVRSNVLQPGCMRRVITVGSTVHRTGFVNFLGEYYDYSYNGSNGLYSRYSSIGPTFEGLIKPDVVAPGDNVISGYSSYYLENNPDALDINSDVAHFDYNGRTYAWNANTGTSMATPVVGGAIALWLQANPKLTPEDVMGVLSRTCRQPDPELTYPNNYYGYGEIDVYSGLLDVLETSAIPALSHRLAQGVALMNDGGRLWLTLPADIPAEGLTVNVYALDGRRVAQHRCSAADSRMEFPTLQPGVYAVQLGGAAEGYSASQLVRVR